MGRPLLFIFTHKKNSSSFNGFQSSYSLKYELQHREVCISEMAPWN